MKKIYTTPQTPAVSNLKNSCSPYQLSFIKTLSLVSVAVFLSNASPVSACDLWGNVAKYFGGGADIRRSIAPSYRIDGNVYRDVGSAFWGVDNAFNGVRNEFNGVKNEFKNFKLNIGNTIKFEVKTAVDTAFAGWGNVWGMYQKEINNKIDKILSDMIVKQDSAGTITIGANKRGYVVDVANNSREARFIVGVRGGLLSPTSDQAVNGSQLYKLGTGVAKSFGGGAGYDKNGNWISPTFMVKVFDKNGNETNKEYSNVADAFTGVNDSFVNIHKEIKNVVTNVMGDRLVKQNSSGVITIGANTGGNRIDITNKGYATRTLTGVHAGLITATSTDAINGSQLYSMSNVVAGYLGGGSAYKDGKWNAPTFTVKVFDKDGNGADKNYHNVAAAFTGISSSVTNLDKKIENIVINATGDKLVKQDNTGLITIGGKVSGTKVSIANVDNATRTLTGVHAGLITATSTDAINGSQLYSMSNVVAGYLGGGSAYKDGKWNAPTFTVKVFDKDGNGADKNYHNVAAAFTGISSSVTNLDKKIESIVTNVAGNDLVKQDNTGLITIGGKVSGAKVSIANVDNVLRTLSGVKAGSITATSNDAINGSQLYAMSNVVAGYFSSDAGYDEDGKWNAPTFTVKVFDKDGSGTEARYENVADALSGVSSSFTNLNKKIENVTGDAFVKQNSAGLITIGGSKGGDRIDISNNINHQRILSGVKGGAFTKTSTEAVNGSQIYYMSRAFASYFGGGAGYGEDGNWSGPTFTVKAFDKDGNETEKNYSSVADAFAGVNSTFTTLNNQIVEIKNNAGIGEKSKIPNNGDVSDIISEGFPFMSSISLKSLPRALGDLKDATTVTVAAKSPLKQISFMNSKGESRRLFDIAAGEISETSTDAVTGSQLYLMNNQIATYFGGGASYKNGNWSSPTFTIKAFDKNGHETENNYSNVADAFSGVNSALTTLNHQLVDISNGLGIGETGHLSQGNNLSDIISDGFPFMRNLSLFMDEEENAMAEGEDVPDVTISPESPSTQVNFANSNNERRRLFNIAAGSITATSTDAINGSQLYSLGNEVAGYFGGGAGYGEGGQWTAPNFKVFAFDKDGGVNNNASYNDVAAAFAGVSETMSKINDRLNIVEQKETPSVASNGFPWDAGKEGYDASHDGNLVENSKDAVNGGQLWAANEKVATVENKVVAIENYVNLVSYDVDEKSGKKTNSITLKGVDEGEPVLIDNVKGGEIKEGSKHAVNGGQLHDYTNQQMKIVLDDAKKYTDDQVSGLVNNGVNEAKAYTDMKFDALSYDINNVRKEARQAAAIGLAVSNLRYFDDPGSLSVSFGGGLWHGQSAFALGAGYTSEDGKIRSNLSATSAGGQWGVGGGITLKLK